MTYFSDFGQVKMIDRFAYFEQIKVMTHLPTLGDWKIDGHFADFGQVKIIK